MPHSTLLEARNVTFSYNGDELVIYQAWLQLRRGALAALIGPNGCGKSTLIRLLAGLLAPSEGNVVFDGVELASIPRRELARKMAYVPQLMPRTFPFTAEEVVLTGRSPHVPHFRFETARDIAKAWQALEAMNIAHLGRRRVTELSAGERQLVSIARALAQEPTCMLLDEPSTGLDLRHRAGVMRTLLELRNRTGLATLMVTHDLSLLDPGFDVVFAMRDGTVAAQGPPSEVLRSGTLSEIYSDPRIRTHRVDGKTLVWSDL
jgi:iron complex transport system ATP-binding protein